MALGEKAFYSPQELADVERQAVARRAAPRTLTPGDVGTDNEAFVDSGYGFMPNGQTSLVVEPGDTLAVNSTGFRADGFRRMPARAGCAARPTPRRSISSSVSD